MKSLLRRKSESYKSVRGGIFGPVVQWIEHHRPKVGVGGSIPSRATKGY